MTAEKKEILTYLFVLDRLDQGHKIEIELEGPNRYLESILAKMLARGLIEVKKNVLTFLAVAEEVYALGDEGQRILGLMRDRYAEYLRAFDVYAAVDLGTGDFALSRSLEMSEAEYGHYLSDERWEDLRVAVVEFKGIDPYEVIYLSFVDEGRWLRREEPWQAIISTNSVWDEVEGVYQSQLKVPDLAYEEVSGEDVIKDVIRQGVKVLQDLARSRAEADPGSELDEESFVVYEDPYYVPRPWLVFY